MQPSKISNDILKMMTMLTQLDERVQELERLVYRQAGRMEIPAQEDTHIEQDSSPAQTGFDLISEQELDRLSMTEISQIAHEPGLRINRFWDRKEAIRVVLNPEPVEDALREVREEIAHFINHIQPSLKQILRCSKQCVEKCPSIQVVDCWSSNRKKIQGA